ncbi:phosphatidylserine decarboxylase [Alicyclobacillaceae bacterium I2511]|nr:phosphatidylserine decarboxylase [Alicyclobacillaceae bacterium I2511]
MDIMPKGLLTRCAGSLFHRKISRRLIPWYVQHYHIDPEECDQSLGSYESLGAFFCRGLKLGSRPMAADGVISPVDGLVQDLGRIDSMTVFHAKGVPYFLGALLMETVELEKWVNGCYVIFYLSPRDYHRVHMPTDGTVVQWKYVPGCLYPVNRFGLRTVPGLYVKNERVITWIKSQGGPEYAVVKIGAALVGGIDTAYPMPKFRPRRKYPLSQQGQVDWLACKGEELARFSFGSTVILIFPPHFIGPFMVQSGEMVHMGQCIAPLQD